MAAADDLPIRLASALGAAYRVERELGGGGMSRIFLAEEVRFRRRVVVKVLAPRLAAGLHADRFEREVLLAAALQNPHIVPVLSAGAVDGLPYYIMPFVDGPSLRARLRDGAPLAQGDAVAILHDVARALALAHGMGVVHRDIKPENVLLAGDTAIVTDFGIARALEASAAHAVVGDDAIAVTLAEVGTSLGTPAYMAPEQAMGHDVDVRTDLYAWGVLAYELLAGRHPFAGRTTASQLMAAQIGAAPAPLADVAPGVPPALAALVMRCLAKAPADRPASASELVAELRQWTGGTTTGERAAGGAAGRRWRRIAVGSVTALLLLTAGGWLLTPAEHRATLRTLLTRPPPALRVNRVVVAPFRDETGDPRLAALGSLTADYLTEGLARLGSLEVVDARTAEATNEVVRRIPRLLRPGDERALGEETGAQVVVGGTYYRVGDSVHFRTHIRDAATGAVRTTLRPVSAPVASPAAGIATLSAHVVAALRAASDEDAFALGALSPPPSLAAFRAFREGYQAYLRDRPDSAIFQPLLRAMALDSTYGAPAVALAFLSQDVFADSTSDWALVRARRLRDRLTAEEQALLDVTEAVAQGDAAAALEAARRTSIHQLTAANALIARRPRVAIAALTATDPDRGLNIPLTRLYWPRLAAAYAQVGDVGRALDAVREGERRVPELRVIGQDLGVLAARGDERAVREGLEERWRDGELPLATVVRATTLLRTRGGLDAEGYALARLWADRFLRTTDVDTLAARRRVLLGDLLVAAGRWGDVLRVVDGSEAAFARDSARGAHGLDRLRTYRGLLHVHRAVALVHLGRRAEALAIDSAFARTVGTRWDRGRSAMARGVIAAHLAESDRALPLLALGLAQGGLTFYGAGDGNGLATIDGTPLLLPLRRDPRFHALAAPDPADGR